MMKLHKQLTKAETPHKQDSLKRPVAATDEPRDRGQG